MLLGIYPKGGRREKKILVHTIGRVKGLIGRITLMNYIKRSLKIDTVTCLLDLDIKLIMIGNA